MGEVVTGMTQGLFWGSGGGFSAVTKRASWQEDMVSAYLKKADLLPPAAMYNAGGRACELPAVCAVMSACMPVRDCPHAHRCPPWCRPLCSLPSRVAHRAPYQTPTPSPSATT